MRGRVTPYDSIPACQDCGQAAGSVGRHVGSRACKTRQVERRFDADGYMPLRPYRLTRDNEAAAQRLKQLGVRVRVVESFTEATHREPFVCWVPAWAVYLWAGFMDGCTTVGLGTRLATAARDEIARRLARTDDAATAAEAAVLESLFRLGGSRAVAEHMHTFARENHL